MNLSQYINSWDKTIVNWLRNPPNSCSSMDTWAEVQIDFMPEPFMGYPDDCSFVIVNLNPGNGVCHSCFKKQDVHGTLINKVKTLGYSNAVKNFPYLQDEKVVGLVDWNNSPGRKWWKSKERWIKHIIKMFEPSYNTQEPIPQNLYPFAMEMFAWHTEKWPTQLNKGMVSCGAHGPVVKSDVIEPLHEAIKKSKYKFAFCVGKPIGEIVGSFGSFKKMNSCPIQALPTMQRFYDVYGDGKGCYIVNTWAQGGNTYPSETFDNEEEILFREKQIIL